MDDLRLFKERTDAKSSKWVHVDKSVHIPGQWGLFAGRPIRRDTIVTEYTGEILSSDDLDRRYGENEQAAYTIAVTPAIPPVPELEKFYIDAIDSTISSCARFANDPRSPTQVADETRKQSSSSKRRRRRRSEEEEKAEDAQRRARENAKFVYTKKGRVFIVAKKNLRRGDELLVDYGNEFWS